MRADLTLALIEGSVTAGFYACEGAVCPVAEWDNIKAYHIAIRVRARARARVRTLRLVT